LLEPGFARPDVLATRQSARSRSQGGSGGTHCKL
jgi:hypothetical protein